MEDVTTLNRLFFDAIDRLGQNHPTLQRKIDGVWQGVSLGELEQRARGLSARFSEWGFIPGDRVAILSENRPEWAVVDYAVLTSRLIDVPVYPTLPAEQIVHLLKDSGARAVFCSSAEQVEKLNSIRDQLPALEILVVFDQIDESGDALAMTAVEAEGAELVSRYPNWREVALTARSDEVATIIYTSGTTGAPKGVMLTHGNIASNVTASLQVLEIRPEDSCLSFLPLSHIFERMVGHYTMLTSGVTIYYASNNDAVITEIAEVRPTLLASVPRIYEKIFAGVSAAVQAGGRKRVALFNWARRVGEERLDCRLSGKAVPISLKIRYAIADRLLFSRLRQRMGGRLRFCVSGGAPLSPDIARFFLSAGVTILEGYGLTETSPVISVNSFDHLKPGTVGRVLPGVEVKIGEDGEILTRGPNLMKGYYQLPEETARAIDPDGWFHTGDVGEIDSDGFLKVTDRLKDLIVTAGGKNISPQPIEALLRSSNLFSNVLMLGDKRRFPIMIMVPNYETLKPWITAENLSGLSRQELVNKAEFKEYLEREALKHLRSLAHFEIPKKFLILPMDFSLDREEITPKLSIRRKVIEARYHDQIEALYREDPAGS